MSVWSMPFTMSTRKRHSTLVRTSFLRSLLPLRLLKLRNLPILPSRRVSISLKRLLCSIARTSTRFVIPSKTLEISSSFSATTLNIPAAMTPTKMAKFCLRSIPSSMVALSMTSTSITSTSLSVCSERRNLWNMLPISDSTVLILPVSSC